MNLVLIIGDEDNKTAMAAIDLAAWERLGLFPAATGESHLLTATRVLVMPEGNADMREVIAVFDSKDAGEQALGEIGLALLGGSATVWLDAKLPSDELMRTIGEQQAGDAAEETKDKYPKPKQLIVRFDRGDATDAEVRDLIGRRIADVRIASSSGDKSTYDRSAIVALITEGPRQ